MRTTLTTLIIILTSFLWSNAQTYTLEDKWFDCDNKAQLLDSYYSPGVTFTWDCSMKDNKANGYGVATKYKDDKFKSKRHSNDKKLTTEAKSLVRSGLFMSGANIGLKGETLPDDAENEVLKAQELSNINLGSVDIVVMSSCVSGLGETSGAGGFGIQRGFKLAGANILLMSLWKVDDTATQLLMTEFYKNYLSGKTKQESLRLAQQSLRKNPEYSNPEYWAAFILLDGIN